MQKIIIQPLLLDLSNSKKNYNAWPIAQIKLLSKINIAVGFPWWLKIQFYSSRYLYFIWKNQQSPSKFQWNAQDFWLILIWFTDVISITLQI